MLLAVDIGNTNIVFGVYHEGEWLRNWRIQTNRSRMPDEYAVLFRDLLSEVNLKFEDLDRVALCSVVPRLTRGLSDMFAQRTGRTPFILKYGVNTGIEVQTDNPSSVGSDLIADAMAAYTYYQSNCIVLDFGTATTISAVATPGVLLGTVIAAGLEVTVDALVGRTAQLPQIELVAPPHIIGKNTIHSMQAGLVIGHVAMIEGIVKRIRAELDDAKVVATGGLSSVLAPLTDCFDRVDINLTLEGLRLITALN